MQNDTQNKKVAVFDIDGTLFRSSLLIELIETLIDRKVFSPSVRDVFENEYNLWLERAGSYEDYLTKAVEAFDNNITGISAESLLGVADDILSRHKYRVYRFTRDLMKEVKDTHFLLAISHSPYRVAEPFARSWGFDKVYALLHEVGSDGRFTGNKKYNDLIFNKDKILQRAIDKENLILEDSIGVGDTESDAPFLDMVARPIAFNPNKGLYDIAEKNNWEIVVERKNVIYNIK